VQNVKLLPRTGRQALRQKAYEGFLRGETGWKIAKELKIRHTTVYAWFAKFRESAGDAVTEKKRGPVSTPMARLSVIQRRKLYKVVVDRTPDQLKFDFALWSSRAIKDYVHETFGVDICRRTARRYMSQLGLTYQCPVKRAREQNPAAVEKWLKDEYPDIAREASACGARIMWGDESSNTVGRINARGYSPRGISPILKVPAGEYMRNSMISAIDNRGGMMFMFFKDAMNTDIFKDFITRLIHDVEEPVFLIVDNLKVHHAKLLQPWFEEQKQENGFRIFYLPSYSPELNPDEYLNRDLKAHLAEKSIPKSTDELRITIEAHLNARKADKASIKAFFEKDEVKYAAANTPEK